MTNLKEKLDKIFKAYDVRGTYPSDLNEEIAYKIGQALICFIKEKLQVTSYKLQVVVGRDARLSSPALSKAFSKGVNDQGANVIDLGIIPSDLLCFAEKKFKANGAVIITASHNPPEYNGIKILVNNEYLSGEKGLKKIKEIILAGKSPKAKKGSLIKKNIIPIYIKHILNLAELKGIKPLKIVIDFSSGTAGLVIINLLKKLPILPIYLYSKPDGRFPHHGPNPLLKENCQDLQKEVLKRRADLGIIFDGDGDRIIFVDEKGQIISGDLIIAFLGSYFLKKEPKAKILYNLTCSKTVPELIKELGGRPIRMRTGHTFAKIALKKEKAPFGGEISGHYYFRDNFNSECSGLVILLVLKILSEINQPFSKIIAGFRRYHRIGEINFEVKNIPAVLKKIEKKYVDGEIDHLDGVTVQYKDWWFNVRPSNTEPLLRLVVEAKTKELAEEKLKKVSCLLISRKFI